MLRNKGLAPIVWVIIVAIVLGGGYFVLNQKGKIKNQNGGEQKTETSAKEIKTDETADWKTYRNEQYGFEFKYPADRVLVTKRDVGEGVVLWNKFTPFAFVTIRINDDADLSKWIPYKPPGSVTIGGQTAKIWYLTEPKVSQVTPDDYVVIRFLRNSDNYTFFVAEKFFGAELLPFLSTFKFAKVEITQEANTVSPVLLNTNGWRSYRSPSNFVFDYPPEFLIISEKEGPFLHFSSPSCDFFVLPVYLDVSISDSELKKDDWTIAQLKNEVMAGSHALSANLRYDEERKLYSIFADGYLPGIRMTMGRKNEELSQLCVNQFVTMLSTLIP